MKSNTYIGLTLLAFVLNGFVGCKSYETLEAATKDWEKVDAVPIVAYKPVGDTKIDGLASPFVQQAIQLRKEVDLAYQDVRASPSQKNLGTVAPENYQNAFNALPVAEQNKINDYLKSKADADATRLQTLLKQVTDLATAGLKLTLEIKDAAGGGAGGATDLANTMFKTASGPGAAAAKQVNQAIEFCPVAEGMISNYEKSWTQVRAAVKRNTDKALSGK